MRKMISEARRAGIIGLKKAASLTEVAALEGRKIAIPRVTGQFGR
jgi:hypothetical protein